MRSRSVTSAPERVVASRASILADVVNLVMAPVAPLAILVGVLHWVLHR